MTDVTVKWLTSDFGGAPELPSSGVGGFKDMLYAVLVTGFNSTGLDALTYDPETGEGVALISSGHTYVKHQVVEISGATPDDYNGQWRISKVTVTEVRFDMGVVPASNGSGSMTIKTAGAGWTMPFESEDGLRAIFKPGKAGSPMYYVDNRSPFEQSWGSDLSTTDNWAVLMNGVEHATGIDDRFREFGYSGYSIELDDRSYSLEDFNRDWTIVATHRSFYIRFYDPSGAIDQQRSMIGFGDLANGRDSAPDSFCINMEITEQSFPATYFGNFGTNNYKRLSRGYGGVERDVPLYITSLLSGADDSVFKPDAGGATISIEKETRVMTYSDAVRARVPIGSMPGMAHCLNGTLFSDNDFIDIEGDLYLVLRYAGSGSSDASTSHMSLFLINKPWY